MQWLLTLETNSDMISICRLMNIFRRKSLMIATLAMTARPSGFSLMGVVESAEAEMDYLFNFLRQTEGVAARHLLPARIFSQGFLCVYRFGGG